LEGVSLGSKTSSGSSELEWPDEVVGFFEVGSNGVDFLNEILNGFDSFRSESLLNDLVIGKGNSLLVDFTITSLQDEFSDGLAGGVSEGDVGFNSTEEIG
jgi:hypothetical protein